MEIEKISLAEYGRRGNKKFGTDRKLWRYKCPKCGGIQTYQDFMDNEIFDPDDKYMFSCIGRWVKGRGCDWTLGGSFKIHKMEVKTLDGKYHPIFEFAE